MCFGVYICIFTLYFMFIAANIVCCRLRHQDARWTHHSFNKLVAVTILQSFAFFCEFLCIGGGANCSLYPGCPMGNRFVFATLESCGSHHHICLRGVIHSESCEKLLPTSALTCSNSDCKHICYE
jgi:hypothetical protein